MNRLDFSKRINACLERYGVVEEFYDTHCNLAFFTYQCADEASADEGDSDAGKGSGEKQLWRFESENTLPFDLCMLLMRKLRCEAIDAAKKRGAEVSAVAVGDETLQFFIERCGATLEQKDDRISDLLVLTLCDGQRFVADVEAKFCCIVMIEYFRDELPEIESDVEEEQPQKRSKRNYADECFRHFCKVTEETIVESGQYSERVRGEIGGKYWYAHSIDRLIQKCGIFALLALATEYELLVHGDSSTMMKEAEGAPHRIMKRVADMLQISLENQIGKLAETRMFAAADYTCRLTLPDGSTYVADTEDDFALPLMDYLYPLFLAEQTPEKEADRMEHGMATMLADDVAARLPVPVNN